MAPFLAALLVAAGQAGEAPSPPPAPSVRPPAPTPPKVVDELVITAPKAARTPEWADRLNLNPKGTYSRSPTPYLRERPVNGCKVMAGGATSGIGETGVAGGLVCAKRF